MISFDKKEVREALTLDNVFELLEEFNAEPEYTAFGIISKTICHNPPEADASRKLYYYSNTGLFHCYTGCADPSFDLFELTTKVMRIQRNLDWDLNEAVRYVAFKFGILTQKDDSLNLKDMPDWQILKIILFSLKNMTQIFSIDLIIMF